jgi:valyl-tRNA synthetase
MMNLEGIDQARFDKAKMTVTDKWILSRLARTVAIVSNSLDAFKYSEPLSELYKFFWNDLCDWYLEWCKPRMQDEAQKPIAQNILAYVLDVTLRLLHPFVPFITEGIFKKLNEIAPPRTPKGLPEIQKSDALVVAEWPEKLDILIDEKAESEITLVQNAIRTIRDIRSNRDIQPKKKLVVSAKSNQQSIDVLNSNCALIQQLAGLKAFNSDVNLSKPVNSAVAITEDNIEIYVHDAVDVEAERKRLEKQKQQIESAKNGAEAKLKNENFVNKAKPQVVQQAKEKLAQFTEQLRTVEKHLSEL